MGENALATLMSGLTRELAAAADLPSMLSIACAAALEPTGAEGGGIFVMDRGRVTVGAVAGPHMVEAELAQLHLDEGPCLAAISEREPIFVAEMEDEGRWPAWASYMVSKGWHSAMAVRLVDAREKTLGSLNLFAAEPRAFGADDAEVAEIFGGVVSAALLGSRTQEQLREAITARHNVGVAQGILMQRYQLPGVEAAFEVLRRYSQDNNVKLATVAQWVITHRELPTAD